MGFKIGDKVTCCDVDGAAAFLKTGRAYTVRTGEKDGAAITLEEVVDYRLGNAPIEERRFHPHFDVKRFTYACGCAPFRPDGAGDDWHLTACGMGPAPDGIRFV